MNKNNDASASFIEEVLSVYDISSDLAKVYHYAVYMSANKEDGLPSEMCNSLFFLHELSELIEKIETDKEKAVGSKLELINFIQASCNCSKHLRDIHNYIVHNSAETKEDLPHDICGNLNFVWHVSELIEKIEKH